MFSSMMTSNVKLKSGKKDNLEETQREVTLSETEKDAVESYIENAEPPIGVSLNSTVLSEIKRCCKK